MRDYYDILNVDKNANANEIKKAYRKVAMKYHPDKNPGDKASEEKFKESAEAYSVLSDQDKKNRYDQMGHQQYQQFGSQGQGFSGGINVEDIFNSVFGGGGSFSDIFGGGDIFGGRSSRQNNSSRGNDLKITINLSLEEIFKGTTKTIKIKRWEKSNEEAIKCSECSGSGEVRFVQKSFLGQVVNVQPCSSCSGMGYRGGRIQKTAEIKINVPIGVGEGNFMTLDGEGDKSIVGSQNGNLIVYFKEKNHELFSRSNNDIYIDCLINYVDAVLGTEIKVPTLSGFVKMKVPEGINNGQLLRLKNKGINELNRHRSGSQYVRINIIIPSKINNKTKSILQDLRLNLDSETEFKKISND
ncbi:MAG: molecular chaperone DnaJ [Candidatus Marinimicrobia bacterium]|nr:molecular chaperone DnaJ [Candidatus Neomarinimicrobiota bacterium]|tara:strand:- start:26165 stop:27232 length:1068 start_codon:yes stop_codon:yes gene_type:complete